MTALRVLFFFIVIAFFASCSTETRKPLTSEQYQVLSEIVAAPNGTVIEIEVGDHVKRPLLLARCTETTKVGVMARLTPRGTTCIDSERFVAGAKIVRLVKPGETDYGTLIDSFVKL